MNQSERIEWIDAIKGFAIILVVMGHVIAWSFRSFDSALSMTPTPAFLWRIIYSFHMPLFMFISGLLFGRNQITAIRAYVKKVWDKFLMLIIPYVISGTLVWLWRGVRPFTYWYLLTLFQMICIVGVINWTSNKIYTKWLRCAYEVVVLALFVYLINALPNYQKAYLNYFDWFSHLKNMSAYFCAGYLLMRYVNVNVKDSNVAFSLCFIFFVLNQVYPMPYCCTSSYSLVAFAAIYCSVYYFKMHQDGKFIKFLKRLGSVTLAVYILHLFCSVYIVEAGDYFITLSQNGKTGQVTCFVLQFLWSSSISAIVIALSLLVKRIINTSDVLSALILGDFNSLRKSSNLFVRKSHQ